MRNLFFSFVFIASSLSVIATASAQAFTNQGSSSAAAAENRIATQASKDKSVRQRKAKRWGKTYKLDEYYSLGMLPANVDFTFSGEVKQFKMNPDNTVTVSMFSAFTLQLPEQVKADLPVKASVRMSKAEFDRLGLREKTRKSWTVDGNYTIIYKTADCLVIHAMDNSLTPEPESDSKRR